MAQSYRLGWKAMPLALEDFDSNYVTFISLKKAAVVGMGIIAITDLGEHSR